jgi:predicted PurR-regulated permease PerM
MDRQLFTTLCVFALLLAFSGLVGYILLPFLPSLGWAGVVTVITFPLYRRLHRRLGYRDTIAAGTMTAIVIVALIIPLTGAIVVLSQEATLAYRYLEQLGPDGLYRLYAPLAGHSLVLGIQERLAPLLSTLPADLQSSLLPAAKSLAGTMVGYSTTLAKNVFAQAFKLFFMLITLFFCYRDGERLLHRLWELLPVRPDHRVAVEETVERVFTAVILGIFLTCVVQGTLGGIGFWVAGLPSPILFGALMTVTAFIPLVGTALVWLPAGLYLLLQGKMAAGIGLLLWGALVVGSIDNLLRPLFISGKAHLPILLVALGALGGLLAFGLIGVVLGPLVLALPLALARTVPPPERVL